MFAMGPSFFEKVAAAGGPPGSSYQSTVLADSPLLFYLLNESSGTIATNLGSFASANLGYQGAYTQNVSTGRSGLPVGVKLDGSSGAIASPGILNVQVSGSPYFSIEAWVLPTSLPGIFRINDSGNRISMQGTSDGTVQAVVWGNAGLSTPTGTLTAAQPSATHLVYTYGSGGQNWYVNGALVSSNTTAYGQSINNTAYFIGCYSAGGYFFPGIVAGHALYNSALTATQVLAHYNAGA